MNEENYRELYSSYFALSQTMNVSSEVALDQLQWLRDQCNSLRAINDDLNLAVQSFNKCVNKLIEKYGDEAEEIVKTQLKEDGLLKED